MQLWVLENKLQIFNGMSHWHIAEEWEAKRLQREKETGDLVKKKFEQAEKEKERYLKNFEQTAKEASAERERILQKGEDLIKDKLKQADEDKKRHLETFDKLAKHDEKKVTIQKTPGRGFVLCPIYRAVYSARSTGLFTRPILQGCLLGLVYRALFSA